jgi:hypothetical protein
VFGPDLARLIDAELGTRCRRRGVRVEPLNVMAGARCRSACWNARCRAAAHGIDAYQAVYVPGATSIVQKPVGTLADPLQVGSLDALLEELRRFASAAALPTDDVELMQLAAQYLESEDADADLDVQTYVQLMLSAKQASARGQALWVVV